MLSWGGTGSAARPATDRTRELTSHIARDFLHLCKEVVDCMGHTVQPIRGTLVLEGDGVQVGVGVCIF